MASSKISAMTGPLDENDATSPQERAQAAEAPEGAVKVYTPSERISKLLEYLKILFNRARADGLCHEAAAMYAVAPAKDTEQYVSPVHSDASGNPCECAKSANLRSRVVETGIKALGKQQSANDELSTDIEELRVQLASLCEKEKLHLCQDRFLSRYKWRKMVELEASVKSLFEMQYVRKHHPSSCDNVASTNKATGLPGCSHYARNCKVKAKCCGLFVGCRFCHDEALSEDHEMNRFATEEILCMNCLTEQPLSQSCVKCGISFGHYFCKICRFYENTPGKKVYHCNRCNICRLGSGLGIDNYHCEKCDACVSLQSKDNHHCMKKALHTNCPVCHGYLFTSRQPVVFMRCGHTMHSSCFEEHTARSYQCPLCSKSLTDMSKYNEEIDQLLKKEPMPSEYEHKRSSIQCHDCRQKSVAKFHFLYHKCQGCGGYNTKVLTVFDFKSVNERIVPDRDVRTTLPALQGSQVRLRFFQPTPFKEEKRLGLDMLDYRMEGVPVGVHDTNENDIWGSEDVQYASSPTGWPIGMQ